MDNLVAAIENRERVEREETGEVTSTRPPRERVRALGNRVVITALRLN